MLQFNIDTNKGNSQTNLAIILLLMTYTNNKKVKWLKDWENENSFKLSTIYKVNGSNKEILIDYYGHKSDNEMSSLLFYYNKNYIRDIEGGLVTTLYKTIKRFL